MMILTFMLEEAVQALGELQGLETAHNQCHLINFWLNHFLVKR